MADRKICEVPEICLRVTWSHIVIKHLRLDTVMRTEEGMAPAAYTIPEMDAIKKGDWLSRERCLLTDLPVTSQPYRPRMAVKYPAGWKEPKTLGSTALLVSNYAAYAMALRLPRPTDTASHVYCDNRECVNPLHLAWEDLEYNKTREACRYWRAVDASFLCPHAPHCFGFAERRTPLAAAVALPPARMALRPDPALVAHLISKSRSVRTEVVKRTGRRGAPRLSGAKRREPDADKSEAPEDAEILDDDDSSVE